MQDRQLCEMSGRESGYMIQQTGHKVMLEAGQQKPT